MPARRFRLRHRLGPGARSEWEPIFFNMNEQYRNTGTYILKGSDDAMAILDEHTVMAQAMQFSIFRKPFEEEIEEWCTRLFTVSETLEQWLKVHPRHLGCTAGWKNTVFSSEL